VINEKIYTVIVTHNRINLLLQCITAIQSQTLPPCKIIVVDNASTDGTGEALQQVVHDDQRVAQLRLEENLGGSGGFSEGIKYAASLGEGWLWLMDDDALAEPTALEELVRHANTINDIYGSVAIDEQKESNLLCWPLSLIGLNSRDKRITYSDFLPSLAKVNGLPFLGFFIHTSLVQKIGFPEKDFFISGDDMEYCLRARLAGSDLWAVGNSHIRHPLPQRTDLNLLVITIPVLTLSPWKRYYDTRNRLLIAKKYHGFKLWTHTLPGTLLRWGFSLLVQQERMQQSRAFLRGIVDGLLGRSGIRWRPGK
jgi:rhamnopyranosyl-N-acetylglucosaminyl-diphospho-decaprenol beta-1,3/1,4-galactofuranosyltransferase